MGALACCAASQNRKDDDVSMPNFAGVSGIAKVASSRKGDKDNSEKLWEVDETLVNSYEDEIVFTKTGMEELF